MKRIVESTIIALAALVVSFATAFASPDKRVALVIGNQNYLSTAPLKNPINDATAITGELERIGFDVVQGLDLDYDALRDTVRAFTREARDADVTVFYYAGHGIAVDGENYVVPIDAKLNDPVDWEFEVYNVAEIMRLINRSPGPSLVFLDACRDNPLAAILAQAQGMSSRSLNNRGILRIPTETLGTSGSVIAYATEPGQVATDGTGDNSPFALALLDHLGRENTDFASITSLITHDVLKMTDGMQRPRFDVSLTGPLMLNVVEEPEPIQEEQEVASLDPTVPTPTPLAQTGPSNAEQLMFEAALASNDVADYEAFLTAFPNSTFAPVAQNAVKRLGASQPKVNTNATEQVAALDTNVSADTSTISRIVTAPLTLPLTQAALTRDSSKATDTALALTKQQRKEVQLRLNLTGNNVGRPDGAIGPNSRKGISSWQAIAGFAPTGYLNAVQHQYLVATTETSLRAHLKGNPNALAVPVANNSSGSGKKRRKQGNGDFWKGVAAGAAGALLLSK